MIERLDDRRIRRVLAVNEADDAWRGDLARLERGDVTLTRASAGEAAIKAVQRVLAFLGYSTSASGAFVIDGDFGRGTNRGLAQFQLEHGLTNRVSRKTLCYPCSFQTARKKIVSIPDVRLDIPTLEAMLRAVHEAIEANQVTFGRFEDALFHLNCVDRGSLLNCRQILDRYGAAVETAVGELKREEGVEIQREWILAIIRQETAGVVRPRFEQHKLSREYAKRPRADFVESRHRSMSIGLGQIMGFNHERVGAPSARAMLFSPVEDQVLYVARFIAGKKAVVSREDPSADDFRAMARYYNGPAYETHFYHERLETWFREFRRLR